MPFQANRRRGPRRVHKFKTRRPDDSPSSASLQRQFEERYMEAVHRMQAAAQGTLPSDAPPVNVSSIYSFMPAQLCIPAGTPYTGGGSAEELPGTFNGQLMSEDMVNLMLEQEYGSVEAGMAAVKEMCTGMDVVGLEPPPGDTTIQCVDIPGIPFYMRLWTGMMDNTRTVCFHIMDKITDARAFRPPELTLFITDQETEERYEMRSTEEYMYELDDVPSHTFSAHDGDTVEFIVHDEPALTVRMPSRPQSGPLPQDARLLEMLFSK